MIKVLYLTNIEVPYRVRFFNELAKYCDLTVLYEREKSANRDAKWAKSEKANHKIKYLNGLRIGNENSFSLRIFREIFSGYDRIIVGCYNSPVQLMALMAMRFFRKPYLLNLDGEAFLEGRGLKASVKRFCVRGAEKYLVAGDVSAESLRKVIQNKPVIPYYFSSLTKIELEDHRIKAVEASRNDRVLVVGQYFDYKGMDVALEAARMDPEQRYLFVGMGNRTELFRQEQDVPQNVEIIPFLSKENLEKEYQRSSMLVLPTRQECWGLVINEAASFGTPIVSTWGSGAAKEFLAEAYVQCLSEPGNAKSLYDCIVRMRQQVDMKQYGQYLLKKSMDYSIEGSVDTHILALGLEKPTNTR